MSLTILLFAKGGHLHACHVELSNVLASYWAMFTETVSRNFNDAELVGLSALEIRRLLQLRLPAAFAPPTHRA